MAATAIDLQPRASLNDEDKAAGRFSVAPEFAEFAGIALPRMLEI